MGRSFVFKLLALSLIAALLLIPLSMIHMKIRERESTRDAVARELAETGVGSQRILGPFMFIPCREHWLETVTDYDGKKRQEKREGDCSQKVTPSELKIGGNVATEQRQRGIYSALFYSTNLSMEGQFQITLPEPVSATGAVREWGDPVLRLGVQDVRGLRGEVALTWDKTKFAFAPGSDEAGLGAGIHAELKGVGMQVAGTHNFSIQFMLQGTSNLSFVPVAKRTQVTLQSRWAHPSFFGRFLPDEKPSIGTDGFTAVWRVPEFALDQQQLNDCTVRGNCEALSQQSFGVALIEPVDVYLKSDRAVNYGFLFIALTFTVFLLFEVLKAMSVHPVQYGLVGLALAIFFLLVISLAEHIDFTQAYAIAAAACVALVSFYVSYILGGVKRGITFGIYLSALYGALYMLLRSEDYALLLGAVLVFVMLALIMVLTRKLDWYSLGSRINKRVMPGTAQA